MNNQGKKNLLAAKYILHDKTQNYVYSRLGKLPFSAETIAYKCNVCEVNIIGQPALFDHNRHTDHIARLQHTINREFINAAVENKHGASRKQTRFSFDVLRAARNEINDAILILTKKYQWYARCPNEHPYYIKEWQIFYFRRISELLAANRNPSVYDFSGDWSRYWYQRQHDLYHYDLSGLIDLIAAKLLATVNRDSVRPNVAKCLKNISINTNDRLSSDIELVSYSMPKQLNYHPTVNGKMTSNNVDMQPQVQSHHRLDPRLDPRLRLRNKSKPIEVKEVVPPKTTATNTETSANSSNGLRSALIKKRRMTVDTVNVERKRSFIGAQNKQRSLERELPANADNSHLLSFQCNNPDVCLSTTPLETKTSITNINRQHSRLSYSPDRTNQLRSNCNSNKKCVPTNQNNNENEAIPTTTTMTVPKSIATTNPSSIQRRTALASVLSPSYSPDSSNMTTNQPIDDADVTNDQVDSVPDDLLPENLTETHIRVAKEVSYVLNMIGIDPKTLKDEELTTYIQCYIDGLNGMNLSDIDLDEIFLGKTYGNSTTTTSNATNENDEEILKQNGQASNGGVIQQHDLKLHETPMDPPVLADENSSDSDCKIVGIYTNNMY